MFTGDLTTEQGKQEYENYIMNNVRNEINSYTKQTQNNSGSSASAASTTPSSGGSFPSGIVIPFAGGPGALPNPGTSQAIPAGWLLCNGNAVSRIVYSVLFTIVGTTYGVGDGSTTFNLPDLRGNVPVGVKSTQASNPNISTLGLTAGTYTYTITANDLPLHSHAVGTLVTGAASATALTGAITATGAISTGGQSNDHSHNYDDYYLVSTSQGAQYASGSFYARFSFSYGSTARTSTGINGGWNSGGDHSHQYDHGHAHTLAAPAHTHPITGSTGNNTTTATTISLVQPSIALNYIIKI